MKTKTLLIITLSILILFALVSCTATKKTGCYVTRHMSGY